MSQKRARALIQTMASTLGMSFDRTDHCLVITVLYVFSSFSNTHHSSPFTATVRPSTAKRQTSGFVKTTLSSVLTSAPPATQNPPVLTMALHDASLPPSVDASTLRPRPPVTSPSSSRRHNEPDGPPRWSRARAWPSRGQTRPPSWPHESVRPCRTSGTSAALSPGVLLRRCRRCALPTSRDGRRDTRGCLPPRRAVLRSS